MDGKRFSVFTLILLIALAISLTSCGGEEAATTEQTQTEAAPPPEPAFDRAMAAQDPFNDPSGPYYHQVLKATSPDGLGFTKVPGVVLDKASVPDIIRMPDGRLIIYAVDGGSRSVSGLMVAFSEDEGETWKQGSLQMVYKSDHGDAVDPEAVVQEDGTVHLYYIVFPRQKPPLDGQGNATPETPEPITVKSAVSSDGINFKEEDGNRLESMDFMTDPDVVKIGDKWFMYVARGRQDVAYSSADGMSFTLVGPIREDGAVSNTVPISGGKYRQFFCRQGISSAVSSDGLTWQDDPGVRVAEDPGKIACDPAPIQLAGGWLMFYKTGDIPQGGPQPAGQGGPSMQPPPPGGQQGMPPPPP